MKYNHTLLVCLSLAVLLSLILSACGTAATPVPPTAVPTTAVPPTAVPPTAAPTTASAASGTLAITGLVNTPLTLTDADLHAMTVVTLNLTHPKKGAADYTGVRMSDLLNKAGVQSGATTVTLTGSDGYTFDIDLATVTACADCMVAFDATANVYDSAMPNMAGKAWVNGLVSITLK